MRGACVCVWGRAEAGRLVGEGRKVGAREVINPRVAHVKGDGGGGGGGLSPRGEEEAEEGERPPPFSAGTMSRSGVMNG